MSKKLTILYQEQPCYDIVIENNFKKLGDAFQTLHISGKKICIVTDSNVGALYADEVKDVLENTGNRVFVYTFPAGEEHKTLDTVENVYEFLIQNKFDRTDMLAALGGGVVGDLTGFTAATYLRGISFIQIPTSLLAQVDSSIGGKTGVDFRAYKNMVGAFYMPKLVYMNCFALNSLSERLFASGLGEIIKHGLICDKEYYTWLLEHSAEILSRDNDTLEQMIYQSCLIKKTVVEKDPTEKGERALLNFGHTLGHAIEKLMNFSLYHGECVVLGIIAALNISKKRGLITEQQLNDAMLMFQNYNFPLTVTGLSSQDVVSVSKNDKKMVSDKIKFILLDGIGTAFIDMTVTDEELIEALSFVIQ